MRTHKKNIHYSFEERLFIKNNCTLPRRELHAIFCDKFNRSDVSVDNLKGFCKRMGWMTGRTGCFAKGNVPHPNAHPKGANKTSFKKGHKPHNWKPVGSKKLDTKDKYEWTKIAEPNVWKQSHYILFEEHYGRSVKPGYLLRFKDGDKTCITIDNIDEISKAENAQLNVMAYNDSPEELKPAIKSLVKLQLVLNERAKLD